LFLGRNCGADYLRLSGDPASGQMRPSARDAPGQEWMLYDVIRQEADIVLEDDSGDADEAAGFALSARGQPVYSGSFDPRTTTFSQTASDYPFQVRMVQGRSRCLCGGGTAGARNVITPVALKVLGEGLVEALADANTDREDHDGKKRLLIFSDSRQDAAHQARFITGGSPAGVKIFTCRLPGIRPIVQNIHSGINA
jgi:hypothetical protein